MRVIGIVLIILGILALGYQGFTYVTQEKVADVGPVQVTTERERTVWIPPIVGGAALIAGIALVALGGKRSAGV
jgi:hypothetical protein